MSGDMFFTTPFPNRFTDIKLKITHLELWAVIIAVRLWGPHLKGKIIKVRTDNEVVSVIVNTGGSTDEYLQQQLRELTWWLTQYQFKIKTVYLPGKLNRLPDLLSRWGEGTHIHREFWEKTKDRNMKHMPVNKRWFEFSCRW